MTQSTRSAGPFRVVLIMIALLASALVGNGAQAQDYPNRRIAFVVPFPPGASSDGLARIVAERLGGLLKQSVIVENKPGAAAYIGHDFVAKAAPDGYTLLLSNQALTAPREMFAMKDFDPAKLASIGIIATSPFMIVVPAEVPAKTVSELVAMARANPGKLNYGVVPNIGMQLDMTQFMSVVKAPMTEVPYNGAAPIATALLGNQVQMSFLSVSAIPQIQAGKLRALAVTSKNRWSRMPDVPSMGDLGLDFESTFWFGMSAPAATPQPIQALLARDLAEVMKIQEVRDAVFKMGMDPVEPSPSEMDAKLRRDRAASEAAYKMLKPAVQ